MSKDDQIKHGQVSKQSCVNGYHSNNLFRQPNHEEILDLAKNKDTTYIHTSNMTNGAVVYASFSNPVVMNGMNGTPPPVYYEQKLLQQIIANDVQCQNSSTLPNRNLDSRSTVIRQVPDGSVQITYRKMVNSLPAKNNSLAFILPKPSSTTVVSLSSNQNDTLQKNITLSSIISHQASTNATNISTTSISSSPLLQHISSPTKTNMSINLPKMKYRSLPVNNDFLSDTLNEVCMNDPSFAYNETDYIINSKSKNIVNATSCSEDIASQQNFDMQQLLDASQQNVDGNSLDNSNDFERLNIELDYISTEPFCDMPISSLCSSDLQLFNPSSDGNPLSPVTKNGDYMHISTALQNNTLFIENGTKRTFSNSFNTLAENFQSSPVVVTCNSRTVELIDIIDVSPEIATTSGGNKIILIGSWNAKEARYSCKFGDKIVDAILIQNGVLRCYSPVSKSSKVRLCVLRNGTVVSNEVDFEFVDPTADIDENIVTHDSWLSISNKSLINLLEERIASIAEIMGVEDIVQSVNNEKDSCNREEKLVIICKHLSEVKVNFQFDYAVEESMTVLHLAAAAGYIKLIQLLLNWVETNPNKLICVEACPTRHDQFKLLPIMWSAAKGHFNTTCVMHQWHEGTILEHDACGCTPIDLARELGHTSLVSYLERILKKSNNTRDNPGSFDTSNLNSLHIGPSSVMSQSKSSEYGEGCRTLGKTLAHIQSIISEDHEDDRVDICSDGEESIFETSSFTPRQRTLTDESHAVTLSTSQLSPASPAQNSPFNRQTRETAEFCEFFFKAKTIEKDFAELTLTDEEQKDLYTAANVIQTAFKSYKDRRKQRDQEFSAAVLIQSYYRRYKQYAAFKRMQKGAVLIQNQYRAHREKFKKKCHAASVIQTYYRRYRLRKHGEISSNYQQRNRMQHQADQKTNRFIHQSTKRFSREYTDSLLMATQLENPYTS